MVGGIPSTVGMTMSHLIRCADYAKESGTGLTIGAVSNIILDPLLMFVLLPAGNEVTGAALATMISNVITLAYYIVVIGRIRNQSVLSLSPLAGKPERRSIQDIFMVGLPSSLSSMLSSITNILRNNLAAGYGDIEIAAYGIVQKIDMIPLNVGMGLCQAMMPLVAYNYASRDYKRMHGFTKVAQFTGVSAAVIFICACQLFSSQIIRVFIREERTIAYGSVFLRIACLATPFIISNFQKIYCLQAMGKGKESLILSVTRQGFLAIPVLLVMNHVTGIYGMVSAQAVSDGITFVLATVVYKKMYNHLVKSLT